MVSGMYSTYLSTKTRHLYVIEKLQRDHFWVYYKQQSMHNSSEPLHEEQENLRTEIKKKLKLDSSKLYIIRSAIINSLICFRGHQESSPRLNFFHWKLNGLLQGGIVR